jgi:DNA invertase Pin-like site-specific DNA recombinase
VTDALFCVWYSIVLFINVDSQRQELLEFIERRDDLELAGEYADVISGTREKREHLDRLMIDARQRKIDVVVFFDLSRLTRKGICHAIGLLDEWKQAGVKPICYSYPMLDFTDDSGMGEMMAAMLAWMAEQERKMIVRRVKAGLAARKAKGLRLGRVPMPMATKNKALRLVAKGESYAAVGQWSFCVFGFDQESGATLVPLLPCTGVTGYVSGMCRYQW